MTRARTVGARAVLWLVGALACGLVLDACTKQESLVLLDLRTSGPLGAPVARVRLSAPGWKTRVTSAAIGPEGFLIGYYGPSDGDAVNVTAEALDGVDCILGRGSATVTTLESGATSAPTTLFIRPVPASGCEVVDAGGGNGDAATDSGTDAGAVDAGTDASDASTDMNAADGGADAPADTGADATDDATTTDASTD